MPGGKETVRGHVQAMLPHARPGDFAQAMMDLGATICSPRRPACALCPLSRSCAAAIAAVAQDYPRKEAKAQKPQRRGAAYVLVSNGAVYLEKRPDKGLLAKIDDPRLDPIWASAGELGLPVLIHIADPVAFFDPLSPENERWDELHAHPDWQFPSPPFPSFSDLIEAFGRLVRRHPGTTFIGAHVACYSENLGWVAALMDECPNLLVDFSARVAELGRQPYSARRFFLRYADRILFGTDAGPDPMTYGTYARFLESEDEYFPYSLAPIPGQGRWRIYGLNLPHDVLDKVYFDNAARLFGIPAALGT
jgi:hypothetical protein